ALHVRRNSGRGVIAAVLQLYSNTILIRAAMTTNIDICRTELVLANRILARAGVLDAFGHVSVRHPDRPDNFLLSKSKAPELVSDADILEYDGEAVPLDGVGVPQYSERFIHSEIY